MTRRRSLRARRRLADSRETHDEGFRAYMEGRPLHLNPYPVTELAEAWAGGWLAAFAKHPRVGNQTVQKGLL